MLRVIEAHYEALRHIKVQAELVGQTPLSGLIMGLTIRWGQLTTDPPTS